MVAAVALFLDLGYSLLLMRPMRQSVLPKVALAFFTVLAAACGSEEARAPNPTRTLDELSGELNALTSDARVTVLTPDRGARYDCDPVDSLAAARARVAMLGGRLDPADREWSARGFRACDGVDPEGNVFQLREPAGLS